MKPHPLTPDVHALIVDHIESVAQLEVLLVLMRDPARVWSPGELAAELRVADAWTQGQLHQLVQHNLATRVGTGFRYGADLATHAVVQRLAQVYQSHPVAVVTLIYTKPNKTLKSFSDAFKLRKDTPGDMGPPPPGRGDDPSKGGQANG